MKRKDSSKVILKYCSLVKFSTKLNCRTGSVNVNTKTIKQGKIEIPIPVSLVHHNAVPQTVGQ